MATVYDKDGKAYEVKHSVDLTEWIEAGYTLANPKESKKSSSKAEEK